MNTAPALLSEAELGFALAPEEQRAPAAPQPPAAATLELFGAAEVLSFAPTKLDRRNAAREGQA
jgi:hypothetical protein